MAGMARVTMLLALTLIPGFSLSGETLPQSRYPIVTAKAGEICIVCGMPVSSGDIAIILKGRRMPVMKDMAETVLRNPEIYFRDKQAKGALFQEEFQGPPGAVSSGVSLGWFLAGLYVLSALIFGGLSGSAAVARGLPPISSFFLGLGLSMFGYLYVLTRPSDETRRGFSTSGLKVSPTQSPLTCPQCGNTNHPAAVSCASCHVSLSPQGQSDLSRAM
jgi:hypothetical protein